MFTALSAVGRLLSTVSSTCIVELHSCRLSALPALSSLPVPYHYLPCDQVYSVP